MDETNRTASFFSGLISEAAPAESSLVLSLFDDASKKACFEHFWSRLQASPDSIDLDTLRLCIRLLPPGNEDPSSVSRLRELVVNAIPKEATSPDRLYKLAELCLSNPQFGSQIFQHVLVYLQALDAVLSPNLDEIDYHASSVSMDQRFPNAVAYLGFLKCSYWLPAEYCHYVSPNVVQALCNLTGLDGMDDAAHDTLSALLSLLRKPIRALASPDQGRPHSGAVPETVELNVDDAIIGQQLWNRYQELPDEYFIPSSKVEEYFQSSGKAYRTWFQWVSLAAEHNIEVQGVYDELYWSRLRAGLRGGFAEQRKYCLGIVRQSLQAAQSDIETPLMHLQVDQRAAYLQQYEKYNSLFETIVLDRYQNQIQACLPELTQLLGGKSLIAPTWITTMLSSVLDARVQEGVRKLVGNWYIDFITQESAKAFKDVSQGSNFFANNAHFLTEGFLPWATQGPMFTATLEVTRDHATCSHGERLANVISRFIVASPPHVRRTVFVDVCRFILDRSGRMFTYSIVHLLQGLVDGFKQQPPPASFGKDDVALLLKIARLPGLEKIAGDLTAALCSDLCSKISSTSPNLGDGQEVPGYDHLKARVEELQRSPDASGVKGIVQHYENGESVPFLQSLLKDLEASRHKCIKDDNFLPVSRQVFQYLEDQYLGGRGKVPYSDILVVLEALWEEADRQLYRRPVVMQLPAIFFHPTVISTCIAQKKGSSEDEALKALVTKAMKTLQQLAEGKPYLLATLTHSLRRAVFDCPKIPTILPFEEFLVKFIQNPPVPKKEFLFEVAAADKLVVFFPQRTYRSYYGKREWHAYAAIVDILNRFPKLHLDIAKRVLEDLLEPWRTQKKPVPIISKWKHSFQLQAMLILSESCITEDTAEWYLESFMNALYVEQWPRYRYLLEWIVSRIYFKFPKLADRILPDLASLDDTSPTQTASLMKLAVLVAPFLKSEKFTADLMTQLIPFSASPKVQVRHESQWAFPLVWDVAMENNYRSVTENPAFDALNKHIRSLDKFSRPAWTIRTLRLDAVRDFTLAGIFEGEYLTIETPERNLVAREDFLQLWDIDEQRWSYPQRVSAGESTSAPAAPATSLADDLADLSLAAHTKFEPELPSTPAPLQTKSGFDFSSLLPTTGPPTATPARPASVVLVASLIDNPTNLGGLSRISESFGLEALTIDSLRVLESKDFKATAVTSHKHQPILEVSVSRVPDYLIAMKRKGYEVVGVEQTDRSGILGDVGVGEKGGLGTLPKKCVLVLGSEKGGVSKEVLTVVDRCVEIRTVGVTRSLNVQTAGGIAVFEWWREWGGCS